MASISVGPKCGCQRVNIYQGSNNPLVVLLEMTAAELTAVSVTLWCDEPEYAGTPLKAWSTEDVRFDDRAIICPWTDEETAVLPAKKLILEAKGLDENGNTVIWEQFDIYVRARRDKDIDLDPDEQGGD